MKNKTNRTTISIILRLIICSLLFIVIIFCLKWWSMYIQSGIEMNEIVFYSFLMGLILKEYMTIVDRLFIRGNELK